MIKAYFSSLTLYKSLNVPTIVIIQVKLDSEIQVRWFFDTIVSLAFFFKLRKQLVFL